MAFPHLDIYANMSVVLGGVRFLMHGDLCIITCKLSHTSTHTHLFPVDNKNFTARHHQL